MYVVLFRAPRNIGKTNCKIKNLLTYDLLTFILRILPHALAGILGR